MEVNARLFELGRYAEAVAALERIRPERLTPQDRQILCEALFQLGEYEGAVTLLERVPLQHISATEVSLLAELLSVLGRYADAVSLLQTPVSKNLWPGGMPAKVLDILGRSLFKLGHYDQSLAVLVDSASQDCSATCAIIAASLIGLGQFADAVAVIERALCRESVLDNVRIEAEGWKRLERRSLEGLAIELPAMLIWSLTTLNRHADTVDWLARIPVRYMTESTRELHLESLLVLRRYGEIVTFLQRIPVEQQSLLMLRSLAEAMIGLDRFKEAAALLEQRSMVDLSAESRYKLIIGLDRDSIYDSIVSLVDRAPLQIPSQETAVIYAHALFKVQRYADASQQMPDSVRPEELSDNARAHYADLLFHHERFDEIADVLPNAATVRTKRLSACAALLSRNEDDALRLFAQAAMEDLSMRRPHHNFAARDPNDYDPVELDFISGSDGFLYDQYNFMGEKLIHVGSGHLSSRMFAGALDAQKRLRGRLPRPSTSLTNLLEARGIDFRDLRIVPPAWTTQIGHLGLMDTLFRMRELGWWQGKSFILARREHIANPVMLSLFESACPVLVANSTVSRDVSDELLSLQRYLGLPFNAWENADGSVVNWSEAGAKAMQTWEALKKGDPLQRDMMSASAMMRRWLSSFKNYGPAGACNQMIGMFVCIYESSSFHRDLEHGHRNATFDNYVDAIRFVVDKGGWVIRMGASSASPVPQMHRLVDYAREPLKVPVLDLHLLRTARYFIGTMSGLTNAALSLGSPAALVNCTTYEAQVWNSKVRSAQTSNRSRSNAYTA